MLKTAFENLRSRCPLIHNITNYVLSHIHISAPPRQLSNE